MSTSEFDDIKGVTGWRDRLAVLLHEAEEVAQKTDVRPRLVMNRRFTEFIRRSAPNTPEMLELDAIAESARAAMMRAAIEERLERLASGSADLARLTKALGGRAADLEADAARLRFERADKVVKAVTDSIRSIRDLAESLNGATDAELMKKVERIISALQSFRNEVGFEA